MRRQTTDNAEAAVGPLLTLRPDITKEGAQQDTRSRYEESPSTRTAAARQKGTTECSHHWIIEEAEGPTSIGECRICGEKRLFWNQFVESEAAPLGATNDGRGIRHGADQPSHREYDPLMLPRSRYWKSVAAELAGIHDRQVI